VDLSLDLKPKQAYRLTVVAEVSSKQRVDNLDVAAKAVSTTRLSFTPGKEDKQIYPVTLRYEEATLQMETQVQGKNMPLEKIPEYTNETAKDLCNQPFKGELSVKGKFVKLDPVKPLMERAMKQLEKKHAKENPLTPFERQQVQAQLEAAFAETTLQSNLSNVLSVLPRQRVAVGEQWEEELQQAPFRGDLAETLIAYGQRHALENMILVDNTSSVAIASSYPLYASNGFDIVSSNKKANIAPYADYAHLRSTLQRHRRSYRYAVAHSAGGAYLCVPLPCRRCQPQRRRLDSGRALRAGAGSPRGALHSYRPHTRGGDSAEDGP